MRLITLSALIIAVLSSVIYSQESFPNPEKCDIIITGTVPFKDAQVIEAGDSSFTVYKNGIEKVISYDKLVRIRFRRTGFWTGALIGGGTTLGVFTLLAAATGKNGSGWVFLIGAVLAVPAGIVGGFIGEFAAQDEIIEFKGLSGDSKAKRLKLTMRKHLKL